MLNVGRGGEEALAVFGSEKEADLFVRSGGLGEGWEARESGLRELVRLLSEPFAGTRSVALGPPPKTAAGGRRGEKERTAAWRVPKNA